MESATNEGLAGNLRRVRETRRLTQEALGERAGVSRNYIASLELGRITNPGAFALYRLAGALGVTLETLLGRHPLATSSVRTRIYTFADAQHEVEARLDLVGVAPFEVITPAQISELVPGFDAEGALATGTDAARRFLAASSDASPVWAAVSFYLGGAIAMHLVHENTDGNMRRVGL
jgi:transcriptional regulator with XRE-family HTH domain